MCPRVTHTCTRGPHACAAAPTRGVCEPHLPGHELQGQEVVLFVQAPVVEEQPPRLHGCEPAWGAGASPSWTPPRTHPPSLRRGARRGRRHLREGQREVEALPQAAEHDERAGGEGARRHLAARALEGAALRALAAEAPRRPVGAGASIAADAGHAASGLRVQLAVLSWEPSRCQRRSPPRQPSPEAIPGRPGPRAAPPLLTTSTAHPRPAPPQAPPPRASRDAPAHQ